MKLEEVMWTPFYNRVLLTVIIDLFYKSLLKIFVEASNEMYLFL